MNLPIHIIIGNVISFVAAIFLIAGCWTRDRDKTFLYQILEAVFLCIANIFFGSWSGISTLLLSAVRNTMLLKNKFSRGWMIAFIVAVVGLGVAVNNRGLIGLLPILATVQLIICNQYAKKIIPIKISLLVNTAIWLVYSVAIYDFSSTVAQAVTCLVCVGSIIRLRRTL